LSTSCRGRRVEKWMGGEGCTGHPAKLREGESGSASTLRKGIKISALRRNRGPTCGKMGGGKGWKWWEKINKANDFIQSHGIGQDWGVGFVPLWAGAPRVGLPEGRKKVSTQWKHVSGGFPHNGKVFRRFFHTMEEGFGQFSTQWKHVSGHYHPIGTRFAVDSVAE